MCIIDVKGNNDPLFSPPPSPAHPTCHLKYMKYFHLHYLWANSVSTAPPRTALSGCTRLWSSSSPWQHNHTHRSCPAGITWPILCWELKGQSCRGGHRGSTSNTYWNCLPSVVSGRAVLLLHLAGEDTPPPNPSFQEISERLLREREERGREKEDRGEETKGERWREEKITKKKEKVYTNLKVLCNTNIHASHRVENANIINLSFFGNFSNERLMSYSVFPS